MRWGGKLEISNDWNSIIIYELGMLSVLHKWENFS